MFRKTLFVIKSLNNNYSFIILVYKLIVCLAKIYFLSFPSPIFILVCYGCCTFLRV